MDIHLIHLRELKMTTYIPTVERTGLYCPVTTLAEALEMWRQSLGQIETIGEAHPVLVRFFVDNGWDKRGWYVSTAEQVEVRSRRNNRCQWCYSLMTFNQSREYTLEVK
jgi:hypothetical protein